MRTVSYVLRFERAGDGEPTVATGLVTVTSLGTDDVPVETTRVQIPGRASYESEFSVDPDGIRFTEEGVITFYGEAAEHTLGFSTLGHGYLVPPADPDTNLTPGAVMWKVDSSTGFFAGATGVISSNFRVDLDTEQLFDDQLGFIQLPADAS